MIKFCKDCKRFRDHRDIIVGDASLLCVKDGPVSLITGEVIKKVSYCSTERGVNGDCQPQALLFLPKNEEQYENSI